MSKLYKTGLAVTLALTVVACTAPVPPVQQKPVRTGPATCEEKRQAAVNLSVSASSPEERIYYMDWARSFKC